MKTRIIRVFCLFAGLLICSAVCSQNTQKGYVKTRGRLGSDGMVIPGERLAGAAIMLKDGNSVVSKSKGTFSLLLPNDNYFLHDVKKQGYVISDPEILSKRYTYSSNPLVLVLEDKMQHETELRAIKRRISNNLNAQLQKRDEEIALLKEQNKISADKYREMLQKLNSDQDNSERLISDMAERYVKIDFDQLDDFNRRISDCIINGRLIEADSLLQTKGDIHMRVGELRKHQQLNALEEEKLARKQKKLERSKALAQKTLEELAQDCYSKFEILKLQHQNDSAAYYIGLRASLDTTNVEWQKEAGDYNMYIMGLYEKSLEYYQVALRNAICIYGESSDEVAACYLLMGESYHFVDNFPMAKQYYEKSYEIRKQLFDEDNVNIADCYNNLGTLFQSSGDYAKAYDYGVKALEIRKKLLGEKHPSTALSYFNVAAAYSTLSKLEDALAYHNKALEIRKEVFGEYHLDVAKSYNGIGLQYDIMNNLQEAEKYYKKAIEIGNKVVSNTHKDLCEFYNNMSGVYIRSKRIEEGENINNKVLGNLISLFGENHHLVAACYNTIGYSYYVIRMFEKSLVSFEKALKIKAYLYGEDHPDMATFLTNVSVICFEMGNMEKALNYSLKGLNIAEAKLGDTNILLASYYDYTARVTSKMGKNKESLDYYKRALAIYRKFYPETHESIVKAKESIKLIEAKLQDE